MSVHPEIGPPDWPNTHAFVPAVRGSTICTLCGVVMTAKMVLDGDLPSPDCLGAL